MLRYSCGRLARATDGFHLALVREFRRTANSVMIVSALTLLLVGCTTTPPTITPAPTTADVTVDTPGAPATTDPNALVLQVELQNTHPTVGMERLAFVVKDPTGASIPADAKVDAQILRVEDIAVGQTMSQPTASGAAARFGDELPGGGVWVVYHDFDSSGPWSVQANVTFPDGRTGSGTARVEVAIPGQMPRAGTRPAVLDTPKVGVDADLAKLTSDTSPVAALYQMTVGEAMASGKPTVILFASPAHCATEACAVTLAEVKSVLASRGSQANFIHIESHDLADPTRLSATAQAWGLPGDLWTVLLDAQGNVVTRIEGPVGRTEIDLWLKRLVGE
jgi:hypothetical protein